MSLHTCKHESTLGTHTHHVVHDSEHRGDDGEHEEREEDGGAQHAAPHLHHVVVLLHVVRRPDTGTSSFGRAREGHKF